MFYVYLSIYLIGVILFSMELIQRDKLNQHSMVEKIGVGFFWPLLPIMLMILIIICIIYTPFYYLNKIIKKIYFKGE